MIGELIKRYFSKDTSHKEKRKIYQYLRKQPSAFTEHFSEKEWNQFISKDSTNAENDPQPIPFNVPNPSLNKKKKNIAIKLTYAVAAVFILCLLTTPLLLIKKQLHTNNKSIVAVPPHKTTISNTVQQPIITTDNSFNTTKQITLPDGTLVTLCANSQISYIQNFEASKRDIFLTGTAIFKVAKDVKRPFTVFCKEVATTALGTKFKITTTIKNKISVKLLEGKVLVQSVKSDTSNANKLYYLLPGSTISFNRANNTFEQETNNVQMQLSIVDNSTSTQFNNIGLSKALDYLANKYNVKINYPDKDISKIRFVGTVYYQEPIENILANIAIINSLKISVDTTSGTTKIFTLQ